MGEEAGYGQWTVAEPRAVLLLVHGLGAHGGRWQAMADFFIKRGISSFAIECPDFRNYNREILRIHNIISISNPAKKIFIIGESLGGVASFIAASRYPSAFSGLICLSPAFKSRIKLAASEYINILPSLFYNAKKEFKLPFDFSMCTRDEYYRQKMESDEREHRKVSSGAIAETIFMQMRGLMSINNMKTPVIFMLSGDDKIIDTDSSMRIFTRLKAKDKTLKVYREMYHSLSIDIGKEKVFEDLLKWVEERI